MTKEQEKRLLEKGDEVMNLLKLSHNIAPGNYWPDVNRMSEGNLPYQLHAASLYIETGEKAEPFKG